MQNFPLFTNAVCQQEIDGVLCYIGRNRPISLLRNPHKRDHRAGNPIGIEAFIGPPTPVIQPNLPAAQRTRNGIE
ncbi:MAG: hypothetical protein CME28_07040 [Gemmatimonadetes bacterium]|nr:hypothetical protein [Gemmatimonadota bacterium]